METYIGYLNTLHSYYAQNPNAYGEKNVKSPYYEKIMVKAPVCEFIKNQLKEQPPHLLVLTGHAGDGKTSLMYQVLKELDAELDMNRPFTTIYYENKEYYCIKDFSELSDEKKVKTLQKAVELPVQGKYVFMVSNTGPLIHTFGKLFSDAYEREKAKMLLINAMDKNDGKIVDIQDYKISIINVAAIDNTLFATDYLEKILDKSLWIGCSSCIKKDYCHIYQNQYLIQINKTQVFKFIKMYYIWMVEYGHRLTIRSITEQLSYTITGGINCNKVKQRDRHKMMFTNLFFGYIGTMKNQAAQNILAIKLAAASGFGQKRMRSDEELLIRKRYSKLFGKEVQKIIQEAESRGTHYLPGWTEELRRMYLFLNIKTDNEQQRTDIEDVFSRQFPGYLDVRQGIVKPTREQKKLVVDALSMMYLGTTVNSSNQVSITMSKESGIIQNVQLVVGQLQINSIIVVAEPDGAFNIKKCNVFLKIRGKEMHFHLTLPMLDFFEELRNGVIATNIDPQLSHGIDSLKAQIADLVQDEYDDDIQLIVLNNENNQTLQLVIEHGKLQFS